MARACRRLPAGIREERYREWVAELPVILRDRDAGPALLFAIVSYCGYAISAACFGVAVALLVRSSPSLQHAGR